MNSRSIIPRLALLLIAFAVITYGHTLNMPFIGDDYVFLDKTRDAGFAELWSFNNVDFEWYRPWSRELHFWLMQRVAGLHEVAYRAVGVVLWITALSLYAAIVRRLASAHQAVIATLGVSSLALWGTPLVWISGGQDLWMLCFTMTSMLLFITGNVWWALPPFGLALLSKETAAVLPALLCAYLTIVERRRPFDILRRTAHFWALVLTWLTLHPTLYARLSSPPMNQELEQRPAILVILVRTILSVVNLDKWPRPHGIGWADVLRVLASAVAIAGSVAILTRGRGRAVNHGEPTGAQRSTLTRFALVWAGIGWLPLFLPSISWHAYYGCLGGLGAWLALALLLQDRLRTTVVVIACLALLRGAQASTLSWDWGDEWYQRRAGNILSSIRDELHRQRPSLPLHSRVFFGHLPNNIGLVVGQSPALRVWYRDGTLQAGFYSYYRPRAESESRGEDFFFRFDSLSGLVEVKAGPEDVQYGLRSNRDWEADHEKLAMLFLRNRDVPRAAWEFEKLSMLPHRADAAGFAAVSWQVVGNTSRADSLATAAGSRLGLSNSQLQNWLATLRGSFPGR